MQMIELHIHKFYMYIFCKDHIYVQEMLLRFLINRPKNSLNILLTDCI